MAHLPSQSRSLLWVLFLALSATTTSAHTIQTAEDVGATLHIEPNDTPRAGEPALAWFALTRKGGEVIPLKQCNCKLSVYTRTSAAGSPPLLTPPLKAVSQERYQDIPGAEIQFPKPGAYQLQLSGTPTTEGKFKPFELKFDLIVAAGTTVPTPSSQSTPSSSLSTTQPSRKALPWQLPVVGVSTVLGLGLLWGVWRQRK